MSPRKISIGLFVITVFAFTAAACAGSGTQPASEPGQVESYETFLAALQDRSLNIEETGAIIQDFFVPEGKALKVEGEDLQVFEYESREAMMAAAETISEDGSSIGTSMVMWVAPPHFFNSGKIIVLYIGESDSLLETLNEVLGPQIAGR